MGILPLVQLTTGLVPSMLAFQCLTGKVDNNNDCTHPRGNYFIPASLSLDALNTLGQCRGFLYIILLFEQQEKEGIAWNTI